MGAQLILLNEIAEFFSGYLLTNETAIWRAQQKSGKHAKTINQVRVRHSGAGRNSFKP
jgi:hypothetical protein